MESRVENHVLRSAAINTKPTMFQAGLSNKFTKRHATNFHDTTLTAASAAKVRTELKMERQATALEKQQQKIDHEMKKIEAITEKLQRQQAREAKRLRNRLVYAAARIQSAFRSHIAYEQTRRHAAAIEIQRLWRGECGRHLARAAAVEQVRVVDDYAARVITRSVRVLACRRRRHLEIQWRAYAATTLQSIVRRHQAMLLLGTLKNARDDNERHNRAAIVIQSQVRGFLTRLVYMDVLYLVCRIQSVARGFLVRKRLRWLLSLNVHGIIQLQALARGFLVRRCMMSMRQNSREGCTDTVPDGTKYHDEQRRGSRIRRASKARPPSTKEMVPSRGTALPRSVRPPPSSPLRQAAFALASMASMASPVPASPVRIKRSYWLPSGASTMTAITKARPAQPRLPQLSIQRPILSLISRSPTHAAGDIPSFDDVAFHVTTIQRMVRGKIGKQRAPVRLEPLVRRSDGDDRTLPQFGNSLNDDTENRAAVERREREQILARKQLTRKLQEKKRTELELAMRQQLEREDVERKLMEREEKGMRLWLKTTQRKHHELKRRRQTLEQQREEKERMEMLREERLVRLHRKRLQRMAYEASCQQRRSSQQEPTVESSESDDPESEEGSSRAQDRREENDHAASVNSIRVHPPRRQRLVHLAVPIPQNTKPSKQRTTKPSSLSLKKTRALRAVYGSSSDAINNQVRVRVEERLGSKDLQAQYASWNFHTDQLTRQPDLVEDDAEFDYGNDFDDIVEETNLTHLIC